MKTITIYTTPTCGFCKALKAFLKGQNISYTEHDVMTDADALDEMQRLTNGGRSVPVTVYNKGQPDQEIQVGFDEGAVRKTLGI